MNLSHWMRRNSPCASHGGARRGWEMATRFRPHEPDQLALMPAKPSDWLPADRLATSAPSWSISTWSGSTRRLRAAELSVRAEDDGDDPELRLCDRGAYLAEDRAEASRGCGVPDAGGEELPDASDDLRVPAAASGWEDFRHLFLEVVRIAREMGLVRFGTLPIDGTKVRANASKRTSMGYGRMAGGGDRGAVGGGGAGRRGGGRAAG